MNKEDLRNKVTEYGEAIITYRSQESNKLKYNVCTLDYESSAYIMSKQNRAKETDDTILMWSWDADAFRLVKCANVVKVEPLAEALARSRNAAT